MPHIQHVGAPDNQNGLPHRIHGPVPSDPVSNVAQGPGKGESPSRYGDRPPKDARKTSHKDHRPSTGWAQLLLFSLFSGEEIRRLEAHFELEGVERFGDAPVIHDGYPSIHPSIPSLIPGNKTVTGTRHVGHLSRLRGRLVSKYLRFAYNGMVYQFQVLPFGLSMAPRTFTRLVRAVGAYLKTCGVNLFQYLDDWLVVGGSYDLTLQYRILVRSCVKGISFLINEEKSDWVPTQYPSFLGSSQDLVRALACPSGESCGINALSQNWDSLFGYAYPPIALRKIRLHLTAEVILVAPFWPSQIWFHQLTLMLVDFPRRLPDKWNLLKNSETGEFYPEPSKLRLVAWKISANPIGHEGFLRQLLNLPPVVNEPQYIGFTIPVSPTIPDGALLEVLTPVLPQCNR